MFKSEFDVQARFTLYTHKERSGKLVRVSGESPNIVLDTGLARMSAGTWGGVIHVGSGNSVPHKSQTSLDVFVAATSNDIQVSSLKYFADAPEPYYQCIRSYRFDAGAAKGNLAEIGMGWSSSKDALWNRALILDALGEPTVITVLEDDFLTVAVELRVYPKVATHTINLYARDGSVKSTHELIARPHFGSISDQSGWVQFERIRFGNTSIYTTFFKVYDGVIVNDTTAPNGKVLNNMSSPTATTYPTTTSAKCRGILPLTVVGDLRTFWVDISGLGCFGFGYKYQITPAIPKTALQEIAVDFELSWGRYEGGAV